MLLRVSVLLLSFLFLPFLWACSSTPAVLDAGRTADDVGVTPTDDGSAVADAAPGDAVVTDAAVADDAATDADVTSHCSEPLDPSHVQLPADDKPHSESSEWWYWTGHLRTTGGRWFGFEIAVFRKTVAGLGGITMHTAFTDIQGNTFSHAVYGPFPDVTTTQNGISLDYSGQRVVCGDGHDTLHGDGTGYAFDLILDAAKRPTLQNGLGYTEYPFGGYTYYYSRERMAATGTVVVGSETFPVTGTAWFDHQYGDLDSAITYGWDWFGIQLDDSREVMLFTVRQNSTPVVVGATLTDESCATTELGATEFETQALGSWTSPHTGCTYPSGWHVRVLDQEFDIVPAVADQELYKSVGLTPRYWEGASTVTGDATGRAYVELSGYCPLF
jgi:predicted secreted hydrolase